MKATSLWSAVVLSILSANSAFAQPPVPVATVAAPAPSPTVSATPPAPANDSAPPAAAAASAPTGAPADPVSVTAPMTRDRVTLDDGVRDGRSDAAHVGLFRAKRAPLSAPAASADYVRGYDSGYTAVMHRRHANVAVAGGFVVLLVSLGAVAWAQSKSGNSGAIEPVGLRF